MRSKPLLTGFVLAFGVGWIFDSAWVAVCVGAIIGMVVNHVWGQS